MFIVSAINYRHKQKSLPKRYQSYTICPLLPLLESARKRTAPRKVDLYDVSYYPLSSAQRLYLACLTGRFSQMVHRSFSYFQRWSGPRENGISLLEEALKKSGGGSTSQAGTRRTRIPPWKKATMRARRLAVSSDI